jgi:hypothetical protein
MRPTCQGSRIYLLIVPEMTQVKLRHCKILKNHIRWIRSVDKATADDDDDNMI